MSPSEDMGSNFCFSRFLLYLLCIARTTARFSNRESKQNPLAYLLRYILSQTETVLEQMGSMRDGRWLFETQERASSLPGASGRDGFPRSESRDGFPAPQTASDIDQKGFRPTRTDDEESGKAGGGRQMSGVARDSLHSNLTFSPTKYQSDAVSFNQRGASSLDHLHRKIVSNQTRETNIMVQQGSQGKLVGMITVSGDGNQRDYPETAFNTRPAPQLGNVPQQRTTSTGYIVRTPDKSGDPLFLDGSPNTLFITDSSQEGPHRQGQPRGRHPDQDIGQQRIPSATKQSFADQGLTTPPRGSSASGMSREWLSKKREEFSRQLTSQFPTLQHATKTEDVTTLNNHLGANQHLLSSPQMVKMSTGCKRVVRDRLPDLKKIFIAYSCYGEAEPSMKMSSANFHRLLKEWGIVRSDIAYMDLHYSGAVPAIRYLDYLEMCCQSPPGHQVPLHSKGGRLTGYLDYKDAELIFLEFSKIDLKGNLDKCLQKKEWRIGSNSKSSRHSTPDKPSARQLTGTGFVETITERIVEARLSFDDFINSLQRIAEITQVGEEESKAFSKILDGLIWKLKDTDLVRTGYQDLAYISKLKEILVDPKKVMLLSVLYRNIQTYYLLYTNNRLQMDFKSFYGFFKDFGICPNMVSSTALQKYFAALASLEVDFHSFRKQRRLSQNTQMRSSKIGLGGSRSTLTSSWRGLLSSWRRSPRLTPPASKKG